ncbi:hypothetical protein [Flavobacterium lipolyticum]|uniref:Uncharacterized protein n=1 Tax=Flavobacterium lipolyticum TaxID=2893754 RepID=A0ABS8M699_9FLAO|nr:hypothetical protein [Flavobacterium sp. F-126]MCC9020224.1 hypothetical protein [Flavobacterium sp. F-126]
MSLRSQETLQSGVPGSSGAGGSGSPPPGSTGILWSSLYLYRNPAR